MSDELELRTSDVEREQVAASLREHCAAGRLTHEELSERLDEAYCARTAGRARAGAPRAAGRGVAVAAARAEAFTISIFGGVERKGRWRVPRRSTPPRPGSPLVRVRSLALLGGADVWRVPPGAKELSQGGNAS